MDPTCFWVRNLSQKVVVKPTPYGRTCVFRDGDKGHTLDDICRHYLVWRVKL